MDHVEVALVVGGSFHRRKRTDTIERFLCGEAVHYREHAISLGVPADAIMIETEATSTNTSQNLTNGLSSPTPAFTWRRLC